MGCTGWISLQSKGLSGVFSSTTAQSLHISVRIKPSPLVWHSMPWLPLQPTPPHPSPSPGLPTPAQPRPLGSDSGGGPSLQALETISGPWAHLPGPNLELLHRWGRTALCAGHHTAEAVGDPAPGYHCSQLSRGTTPFADSLPQAQPSVWTL